MRSIAEQLRRVLGRVYSVGIYAGPSPLALAPDPAFPNPVLTRDSVTDHLSTFVADPFMIRVDGRWHLFFEALSWRPRRRRGEIAVATSRDARSWEYQGTVLAEPFHLSYPYVFEHDSDFYMVPESSAAGAVRLYRADPFPLRWSLVATLLRGGSFLDNSIFRHEDRWWMLTETDPRLGTLRLFHASALTGPWEEHPGSPVVAADRRVSRSAGRVISMSGRPVRFAQDCRDAYGSSVSALEITRLDRRHYEERELSPAPVLAASGRGWNRLGMHHVDAHRLADGSWIACVDGWSNRVRRPRELLRWAADHWAPGRPGSEEEPWNA